MPGGQSEGAPVVIVGAGFGGLAAATALDERGRSTSPSSTATTSTRSSRCSTRWPPRAERGRRRLPGAGHLPRQPNVAFRQATVTGVDWDRRGELPARRRRPPRRSTTSSSPPAPTANFFGVAGRRRARLPAVRPAPTPCGCATTCSRRFEAADADPSLIDDGALTFVVVGGGPTGVEVAGALAELFDKVLRKDFHASTSAPARVVLVEMVDHLLAPFSPASSRATPARTLRAPRRRGAHRHAGRAEVGPDAVVPGRRRASSRPTRSSGRPACRPTRSRRPSASTRAGAGASSWARPADRRASRRVRHRRRRRSLDAGPARRCPQRRPGGHAGRPPRRPARSARTRAAARRRDAVPLPRQGHHGHDRPAGGRGRAAPAASASRAPPGWLAWLGLHLVLPDRLPQPAVGAPQLGVELLHLGPGPPPDPRAGPSGPSGGATVTALAAEPGTLMATLTPSEPPSSPTKPPSTAGDREAWVGRFTPDATPRRPRRV